MMFSYISEWNGGFRVSVIIMENIAVNDRNYANRIEWANKQLFANKNLESIDVSHAMQTKQKQKISIGAEKARNPRWYFHRIHIPRYLYFA